MRALLRERRRRDVETLSENTVGLTHTHTHTSQVS